MALLKSEFLGKFKALSPRRVIELLAYEYHDKKAEALGDLPYLTLTTVDGLTYSGRLLDLSEETSTGRTVLFHVDDQFKDGALLYLHLERIGAVLVHGPRSHAVSLSDGKIGRSGEEEAPTVLELRRFFEAETSKHATAKNFKWELPEKMDSEMARLNIRDFLRVLIDTMTKAEKEIRAVDSVALRQVAESEYKLFIDGKTLVCQADFNAALPRQLATWTKDTLFKIL